MNGSEDTFPKKCLWFCISRLTTPSSSGS
uniref:Uncharacterized protein n=1 Tax=Arundo donax TaxID=35708 RepID=A0A0A9G4V9_ARUDO